jgi:ABC-type antimicrobial peptide transport system permease subunit
MPGPSDRQWYFYDRMRPRPPGAPASAAPAFDNGGFFSVVTVTVRLDSRSRARAIEHAFRRVDPSLTPVVTFVDDTYAEQNAATLLAARLVGGFSGLAWIIAMVGLYGVISYFVVTRTREIGIRMALGADRRHIRRQILAASSVLVVTGLLIGVTAAWLIARALHGQLFGVSPADPVTFLAVAASVALTALVASWRPAERAAGTNPATTLRSE